MRLHLLLYPSFSGETGCCFITAKVICVGGEVCAESQASVGVCMCVCMCAHERGGEGLKN